MIVANTMPFTGVRYRSLTSPDCSGTVRSSDQASMYRVACRSDSGVPLSAHMTNAMPDERQQEDVVREQATMKLKPGRRPPGRPSASGSVFAR